MLQRVPTRSKTVVAVGYDAGRRVLDVELRDGSVYRYLGVPPVVHRDLLAAPSIGHYFAHFIKTQFACEHIGMRDTRLVRKARTSRLGSG